MKMGPVTAVRTGSPAAEAGVAAGDLIEAVDGKKLGEGATPGERWDGETLPDYLRRAAAAGREVELTVLRATKEGEDREMKVRVKPQLPTMMNMVYPARSPGTPMAANEIGVSYQIQNEVASVAPDSPAAVAKVAAGDKILRAKITLPKDKDGKTPDPIIVKFVPAAVFRSGTVFNE